MRPNVIIALLAILLAGLLGMVRAQVPEPAKAQPAAPAAPPVQAPTAPPVKVVLFVSKEGAAYNVELVGRKGDDIYYRRPGASQAEGYMSINLKRIARANFEFKYDDTEVYKCASERRWPDAAGIIMKTIAPAIPYLDLSTNNVVEPALKAAGYLFKAGAGLQEIGGEANQKQAAAFYAQAYKIFQQAGFSTWFEGAYNAQLKAIQCLAMMDRLDSAEDELKKMTASEDVYDESYGLYWLVQATILYKQKNYSDALDAAVKSLAFQNKDPETFPDALLISAHCYYELQEMYRARDVYYEILRLFDRTDWGAVARKQLTIILKNNLTKGKERANYWKTFIDSKEDVNKSAEDYLKATQKEIITNTNTITAKPSEGNKTP